MGYQALVVNPDEDTPGMKNADVTLVSDIFDRQRVLDFSRKHGVGGIISDECDIAMNLVADYGKELGLSALDAETASLYTDKYLMREFCKKYGLPSPEYRLCESEEDAIALLHEINHAIILKPLDSNSSRGVFRCDNEDEIRKHFSESLHFSRVEKKVLAERFITGTEFTIDGVKTPSAHYSLAISEKKHFKHNPSIANELLFSHHNDRFDYNELRKANDAFVMHSNLQFGFTHAEYKYEDGNFYLIEIAARGGGNMISSCVTQFMSGYDTYKYLVECSLGNVHDEDFTIRPNYKEKATVLKFFATPNGGGKVKEIHGLDFLEKCPEILAYRLNFKVGDVIENAKNDSARIGYFIAGTENLEALKQVMRQVNLEFSINLE